MRTRLLGIQRPRQHPMPQRQHHLDHPSHPRSRLRMTKIRLQRPQPQRPINRPTLPIRRQQRLRLNRIPQPSPRPMPLHHINITHRQTSAIQRPTNHPLLRRPIRRGEIGAGAVLIGRTSANDRPDPMPATARVGQPLQHQHPHPLRQPSPVRPHPERPAPTITRQPLPSAELDQAGGCRHHRDAAGQCQRALPSTQCLARQVNSHQRRRTRRVHTDRRTLQPQHIRHPTGHHTVGAAGDYIPLQLGNVRPRVE